MSEPIDWVQLDQEIRERNRQDTISGTKIYSSSQARIGIELIIGEDRLREAVDYYVAYRPEAELVRNVLWQLRPWSAMQRCYEIYKNSTNIDDRIAAIELLRVVGDARALDWVKEFLADPNESIQNCGVEFVDQLLFGGGIMQDEVALEKAKRLLEAAENHSSSFIREKAVSFQAGLAIREARTAQYDAYMAGLREPS